MTELPPRPTTPQDAPDPARERLAVFEDAVQRVRGGQMTVAAFGTWLEQAAAQMAERQRQLQEIYATLPTELEGAFRQEAEIGFQGIAHYLAGIERLREYVQTQSDACLDQALAVMRKGNALIVDAMRINRENREADVT